MYQDLFKEINNATLDLQAANYQTYERPLKKLAGLLHHPDFSEYNGELIDGLDLDEFLTASSSTSGSMAGSAQLLWPDELEKYLGLFLLLMERFKADPQFVIGFSHKFFYSGKKLDASLRTFVGQLIIPFVRDYKDYVQREGYLENTVKTAANRKIFIVHGHDNGAKESVARYVEKLGFEAIILHEQANRGQTVIEKIEEHSKVAFAVVLLTPDDEGCRKGGTLEPRARQNVLLELGYFLGCLGRDRVCALKRGELELPSDYVGVVWEKMDDTGAWKQSLARELDEAGFNLDWKKVMRA